MQGLLDFAAGQIVWTVCHLSYFFVCYFHPAAIEVSSSNPTATQTAPNFTSHFLLGFMIALDYLSHQLYLSFSSIYTFW